ncbi:lipoate--protein ligase family protein [Gorillibacterium sp. sgz5001074]|uniref:lipoate--protein ligase family protein n=1 Tax=Gorillibacterium sp. sgz5001074 TaxID=3446695 RepID=UPI003F66250C
MSLMTQAWPQGMRILEVPPKRQPEDVLHPFAWDEAVCRHIGSGRLPPAAHIWRHPGAMVLGLRDRRLPHAEQAMRSLREQGLSVAVRNSGGAAVPLDAGVVNLSLLYPIEPSGRPDFRADFSRMASLIAAAVGRWSEGTVPGEIRGAYCPGEFDLSIGGRKFCGIAQRRQLKGVVVSAFIVVEGKGSDRGVRAQSFYKEATGGEPHPDDPGVCPETMGSLEELAGIRSAAGFAECLTEQLLALGGLRAGPDDFRTVEEELPVVMAELRRRYNG